MVVGHGRPLDVGCEHGGGTEEHIGVGVGGLVTSW